jgi:predicted ribonuclease YlaK
MKDIYQKMAVDSMMHNDITLVRGHAGSGKSLLSLAYLF